MSVTAWYAHIFSFGLVGLGTAFVVLEDRICLKKVYGSLLVNDIIAFSILLSFTRLVFLPSLDWIKISNKHHISWIHSLCDKALLVRSTIPILIAY